MVCICYHLFRLHTQGAAPLSLQKLDPFLHRIPILPRKILRRRTMEHRTKATEASFPLDLLTITLLPLITSTALMRRRRKARERRLPSTFLLEPCPNTVQSASVSEAVRKSQRSEPVRLSFGTIDAGVEMSGSQALNTDGYEWDSPQKLIDR